MRIIDADGVAAVTHVHSAEQWNPSAGNPLPPAGYRDLFEGGDTRVFGEQALLSAVLVGHLDLAAVSPASALETDLALSVISSRRSDVYVDRALPSPTAPNGVLAINPLYEITMSAGEAHLRLRFPSRDYEDEYRACRLYLPDSVVLDRSTVAALRAGRPCPRIDVLRERRVILDVPPRYLRACEDRAASPAPTGNTRPVSDGPL